MADTTLYAAFLGLLSASAADKVELRSADAGVSASGSRPETEAVPSDAARACSVVVAVSRGSHLSSASTRAWGETGLDT